MFTFHHPLHPPPCVFQGLPGPPGPPGQFQGLADLDAGVLDVYLDSLRVLLMS